MESENGLYLYCIRIKSNETIEVCKTISGEKKIQILTFQDLEAVTSEVSLNEFSSAEIQKKAEEDLEWIKGKAQIHEEVIEQAMRTSDSGFIPVIPMQFGVIFKSCEKLEEALSQNLDSFRNSLEFLSGKQEWCVKAFIDQKIFGEFLEKRNEELLGKKKGIDSLPKGLAFFEKKKITSAIDEIKEKELDKIINEIYNSFSQSGVSCHQSKILDKDFTLMNEDLILNGFCLIDEMKLPVFKGRVEEFKDKFKSYGIKFQMTGPWPCYHFA